MNPLIQTLMLVLFLSLPFSACEKKEWDILSPEEKYTLHRIRTHWDTWIPQKKEEGTAPMITWEELYEGLKPDEENFLDRLRAIKPATAENPPKDVSFRRIENQEYVVNGEKKKIGPQYLPEDVYLAYEKMMESMQQDIGKRLLVDSGYRGPAYQLYTFLFYLPKHRFSLVETTAWVALPGHSEHGNPKRQALDFMNEQGINGDTSAEDFERLEEYKWLQKYAHEFGFELSYPRGTVGTTFEPWHWRYIGTKK
jgi:LAS superfamily LD-carboxypeptidase LdcB